MKFGEWIRRIWYLLNRRRFEAELESEMEAHREMLSEASGEQPRFGNTLALREQSRDVWGWHWLDTAWQDLRYARRTLTAGFAITAPAGPVLHGNPCLARIPAPFDEIPVAVR